MSKQDPVKEQILNQADIADIISQYVNLTSKGNRLWGLSPFNKEKTPSFTVHPERQFFHCFSSGKSGNVIDFVMEMEHLSFFEAKQFLANKLGIELPKPKHRKGSHQEIDRFQVMDTAAQLYRQWLKHNPTALEYARSRGLNPEQMEHFAIGYAPDSWDALTRALQERRIPEPVQIELGLVVKREKNTGCYDRFRNRIMFPIRNLLGRVIAFGGRALSPEDPAKYLNTNETPLFNKSRVLYLLDTAKNHLKENGVIVVEGFMDAIALHIHGFENTVATLGTSLTREHIHILKRYTNRFTLLYDSDQAGINAAMRGVESFFEAELPVRVLLIDDAKDPDEFLQKHGKDAMAERLQHAPDGFSFYLQQKRIDIDTHTPEGKTAMIQAMLPLFARIRLDILRKDYIQTMAASMGGDLSALEQSIYRALQSNNTRRAQPEPQPENTSSYQPTPGKAAKLKRELLTLLAVHHGLYFPDGMSSRERVSLFSDSDVSLEWLAPLRDDSIEDRLLEKAIQLPSQKIEHTTSFLSDWLSDPLEHAAFIRITETTMIPNQESGLRKMKADVIEGLQLLKQKRQYQDTVRSGGGDWKLLKSVNEQMLHSK